MRRGEGGEEEGSRGEGKAKMVVVVVKGEERKKEA